ncbi:hypothetical protein BCR36DRAFT_408220 [Piromyces finnis]|uniref:Scaffoldin n=1 Tax=Piromyces finnis TaxID=1754191 RepID=A0A1Y1VLN5_9FUNG|nr:hypothetical protein BCR36DRAFT_408220 [Piromyces finnis]|eukprot:ORX59843.1 hypothetical protein BCR36DRAFT_408220 [Piromyces finnis]
MIKIPYTIKNYKLNKIKFIEIWFLLHYLFLRYTYSAALPSCISKNSICTLSDKSLLQPSKYCISSTTIYMGIDETGKCKVDSDFMKNPGNFFFNSDYKLMRSANVIAVGYICSGIDATKCRIMDDGIYINSVSSTLNFAVDYSASNTNTTSKNIFIDQKTKFYINSGVEGKKNKDNEAYPLIKCDSKTCKAVPLHEISEGFYINSGDVSKKTLIECNKTECNLKDNPTIGYYINADKDDVQHPLIHCNESQGICEFQILNSINSGYYINSGSENKKSIIRCDDKSCYSLILSENLSQGYYLNAGDSSAPIITCNKNSCSSGANEGTKFKGSYQLINNSLRFRYTDNDTIECNSDNDSESLYYMIALEKDSFPGVSENTQVLIKISKNSISQVVLDSYLPVGKSDLKLKHGDLEIDKGIDLYYCSKSSELCLLKSSCNEGHFLLDTQSQRAYYCSNNKLIEVTYYSGYYIDSGSVVKSQTPYLISCNNGKCKSLKTPLNYYRNAAIQFKPNSSPLIYCSSSYCFEVIANPGYYLTTSTTNDKNIFQGVIHCKNESSECVNIKSNINTKYYINEGFDKNSNRIIRCTNYQCKTIKASNGYYFSENTSQLIYCSNTFNCVMINAVIGYYFLPDENQQNIIKCLSSSNIVTCEIQKASKGFYISVKNNILIDCLSDINKCSTVHAVDGIYRSAITSSTHFSRNDDVNKRSFMYNKSQTLKETSSFVNSVQRAINNIMYNIIICKSGQCNELSSYELNNVPYCTYTNNKCFIINTSLINEKVINRIEAGEFCTNFDRSIFYFATNTIDLEVDTIDADLSIYSDTTTITNCVIVSNAYANNYFLTENQIFRINEGRITKMANEGYYFIDIDKNVLLTDSKEESLYNKKSIKLSKCDGQKCKIVEKTSEISYYADVNKHIIKYDPNNDKYSFPYEKDIICIYKSNSCTPKYDLKNNELCITYKGELALVSKEIIGFETGSCYKAASIINPIYGLSTYFYEMDTNSAKRIVTSGYYLTDSLTNGSINIKKFSKASTSSIYLYGCIDSRCKLYEPMENSYYYDNITQHIFKYENSAWYIVDKQGYSFIKMTPELTHVYKISKLINNILIEKVTKSGYYYTIDNNMYECYIKEKSNVNCIPISNSDYYYTIDKKLYYCAYDSENLEKTLCNIQLCISGQIYYFNKSYYRCNIKDYIYEPISENLCHALDTVIINYPTFLEKEYPTRVKLMLKYMYEINITDIETNYNSSYIPSITGVFNQCKYDVNNNIPTFNLICLNNFVALSSINPPKICSIKRMGLVECIENEEHPGRCHPDNAWSYLYNIKTKSLIIIVIFLSTTYLLYMSI